MKVLLWLTIIARVTLCLRGDDDASGALSLAHRGQRRMQTSEDVPRQPLDDVNLFRRESAHNEHENEADDSAMTENHSSSNSTQPVSKAEPSMGKGNGSTSKGKGKGSSSKSMKSSKKEKLHSKKSKISKASHSFKKKKYGNGRMNHVSGKGQTSGPIASPHHSSKIHSSGKGSETSPPVSSPLSSPNQSPVANPTSSSPNVNPPQGMTEPSAVSGPTASPTIAPTPLGETLQLSDFDLAYVFDREGVPLDSDVQAAVSITKTYLNGFSKQRLGELKELDTRKVSAEAVEPPSSFHIGFESTAFFVAGTDPLPTAGEMDLLTTLAFSGENLRTYLDLLGQLPESNIFSTTSDVYDSISKPEDTDTSANVAIGASASAGAFIALLIGVAFYRKRSTYVDLDKLAYDGHITVAGETYIGGSTMYSSSEIGNRFHQTNACDDVHSMWGISTKAATEDCASEGGESMEFGEDTLEHQLGDLSSYAHLIMLDEVGRGESCMYPHDPLAPAQVGDQYGSDDESRQTSGNLSSEEHAEDADVPLRVVDLIRRFSPLSR